MRGQKGQPGLKLCTEGRKRERCHKFVAVFLLTNIIILIIRAMRLPSRRLFLVALLCDLTLPWRFWVSMLGFIGIASPTVAATENSRSGRIFQQFTALYRKPSSVAVVPCQGLYSLRTRFVVESCQRHRDMFYVGGCFAARHQPSL